MYQGVLNEQKAAAEAEVAVLTARLEAAKDEAKQAGYAEAADETTEQVFDALCDLWPDYDFGGCYDLSELLSHAAGRLGSERADSTERADVLTARLTEAERALGWYARGDCWAQLESDDWILDCGDAEPWALARAALDAAEPGKEAGQ